MNLKKPLTPPLFTSSSIHESSSTSPNVMKFIDLLVRRLVSKTDDSAYHSTFLQSTLQLHNLTTNSSSSSSSTFFSPSSQEPSDPYFISLRRRCLQILGSRISISSTRNDVTILDMIVKMLMHKHTSTEAILRFSVLSQKLQTSQLLTRKWATLLFLHSVSIQASRMDDSSFEVPMTAYLGNATNLNLAEARSTSSIHESLHNSIIPSPKRAKRRSSYEELSKTGFKIYMETHLDSYNVPESLLVRDLLFIFQGIDGQLLKFNSQKEEVEFADPHIVVPRPTKDLIRRLTEVGFLYRKLQTFVNSPFTNQGQPLGLIAQSLKSVYQKELSHFFRLLAVLEQSFSQKELTLRRLFYWSVEPAERFRLLHAIVQACQHVQGGGALLGAIQTFTHHGDPTTHQFIHQLLTELCKPFFSMVRRWVYEGELVDPYFEFFVRMEDKVEEEEWWKHKYVLRSEMVPAFLETNLAKKIYLIGKSLNFLKCRAKDHLWVSQLRTQSQLPTSLGLEFEELHVFEQSITMTYQVVSKRLIQTLMQEYHLKTHLLALKKYLLLGQGDFIQALMEGLATTLSRPASTLYHYHLTGILETAIRSCNAQFDSPEVLRRLDVRLLQTVPGEDGWGVFSLDYHIDAPLTTVITSSALQHYLKLFNFLWRLKRAERALGKGWHTHMQMIKLYRGFTTMQSTFHQMHLIWSEMTHFIYQMQYYFLLEVLECSWDTFMKGLEKETLDLDTLITLHNRYLNQIATRGLLTATGATSFVVRFGKVFDLVQLLKNAQDMLQEYAKIEYKKALGSTSVVNSSKFSSTSSSTSSSSSSSQRPAWVASIPDHHTRSLTDIVQHINNARNEFKNVVGEILGDLSSNADDSLRNLAVRLNFNEYYPVAKKPTVKLIDMDVYQP